MDLNKSFEPETEMKVDNDGFDRNLRKVLFELQRKRKLLEECRHELNKTILKQQDLERQLSMEKHKNTNEEYHRIILRNGAEALEEARQKNMKELSKLKVQLELNIAERDSLRNQVRSQCLEINNLKRKIDDLSSKHRCHSGFQKDISEQLSKIKITLNQVDDIIFPLRKKQEDLENICRTNNRTTEELYISVKQLKERENILEKERDELEKKLIFKSAELSKLQELLERSSSNSNTSDMNICLDYWKGNCDDLETQLQTEKDGNEQLTNALKLSHENEEYLRNELLKNESKISELEKLEKCHEQMNDAETQTEIYDVIEIVDLVKSETE